MTANSPLWNCPLRTKAKLEILGHYLGAWFGILARNGFQHVYYIDGFCGPGQYLGGEEGSPVIAARLASSTAHKYPGFKATLIFIDKDPKALEHLGAIDAIKNRHSNVVIDIKQGVFVDKVDDIIRTLQNNPSSPTFSFIDPFGFGHTPFKKIKLLMHNKSSEVFVNFMCGYMNRFKEHPDKEIVDKIKSMVGEDDLQVIINAADPIDKFCEVFESKLKRIGQYTKKFIMRDEMNIRDNAFFFCGQNPRGFEKIKEAMWKVDPMYGGSFSAHKESNKDQPQTDLFGGIDDAQTYELLKLIISEFSGRQNVPVKEIFAWVIERTDTYLSKHARQELEKLYSKGCITNIKDPDNPSHKRRKNSWPERLLLSFADDC